MNNNRTLLLHIVASFVCITTQIFANQASVMQRLDFSPISSREEKYHIIDLGQRLLYKEREIASKYRQLVWGKPTQMDRYLCERPSMGCIVNEEGYIFGVRVTGFECNECNHIITTQNANKHSYAYLAAIYCTTASRVDTFNKYLNQNKFAYSESPVCAHIASLAQNVNSPEHDPLWWNQSLYIVSHFDLLRDKYNRLKNDVINQKNCEALQEFVQLKSEHDQIVRKIDNQE